MVEQCHRAQAAGYCMMQGKVAKGASTVDLHLPHNLMQTVDDAVLSRLLSQLPDTIAIEQVIKALASVGGDEKKALLALSRSNAPSRGLGNWLQSTATSAPPPKKRKLPEFRSTPNRSTNDAEIIVLDSDSDTDTSAPSKKVPAKSLNDVLKDSTSMSSNKSAKVLPLMLGTPALVAKHTPCTLIKDVLPPELASLLYLELLEENRTVPWKRNEWYIFERLVESPHTTAFYFDSDVNEFKSAGLFWYNGRANNETKTYTPHLRKAQEVIEPIINNLLDQNRRYGYEWAGRWKANVAASNCYSGSKEAVGYHSDRLNYLGPCPTIASISLGTSRIFRLRSQGEDKNRTFDIPLPHNSLLVMHATTQEAFKHAVPPQRNVDLFHLKPIPNHALLETAERDEEGRLKPFKERINITFRFYRPDFCIAADDTNAKYPPLPKCKCEQPCVLRPDMKHKPDLAANAPYKYFWMCGAGAANEGKSCNFFEVLDMTHRGPCIKDVASQNV